MLTYLHYIINITYLHYIIDIPTPSIPFPTPSHRPHPYTHPSVPCSDNNLGPQGAAVLFPSLARMTGLEVLYLA